MSIDNIIIQIKKEKHPIPGISSLSEKFMQEYIRIMNLERPHEILGIPTTASPEIARKVYYALVKVVHPDRVDPYWKKTANRAMVKLTEAYERVKSGEKQPLVSKQRKPTYQDIEKAFWKQFGF